MVKKCVIIAGGTKPAGKLPLNHITEADYLICADGGANVAYSLGYIPDLIVGDFDSVAPEVLKAYQEKGCPIETYPVEKDYTDTQLALELALEQSPQEIILLAATGSRLDHSLANVLLLVPYSLKCPSLKMVGDTYEAWICRKETLISGQPGDLLSLIPLSNLAQGITLEGFKYPLQDEDLTLGSSRGISNVLLGSQGRVTLKDGILLVVRTEKEAENSKS